MELFQIRSFLKVAEEGSITRAAEALCLTQPAVTQHVRALERELGVALFDRTGRGVRLTAAGLALREYARRSLGLLGECRQAIADLAAGVPGGVSEDRRGRTDRAEPGSRGARPARGDRPGPRHVAGAAPGPAGN